MALIEMIGFIAVDQIVGWAASLATAGTTAAAAQAVMAALLARYGIRIAGIIRALRAVANSYRAGMAAASAGMTRAAEALMPLLGAQPLLAGVGGTGTFGPGLVGVFMAELRRPQLRKETVDAVLADTRTRGFVEDISTSECEHISTQSEPCHSSNGFRTQAVTAGPPAADGSTNGMGDDRPGVTSYLNSD